MFNEILRTLRKEGVAEVCRKSVQRMLLFTGTQCMRMSKTIQRDLDEFISSEEREILARNAIFLNRHAGKRCFVIGSGPSLQKQDLSYLKGEIIFSMNSFWKHPILNTWQPTYYCFADPIFFNRPDPMKLFFQDLKRQVRTSDFFVPLSSKRIIDQMNFLPSDKTFFVRNEGEPSESTLKLDLTKTLPIVSSVSQLAIMIAVYMGCSPIYLMGLDHDWLSHRGQDKHFYDGKSIQNHPEATGLLNYPYIDEMRSMTALWESYYRLDEAAKGKNLQILNATAGGFLDVFPRANYESLFQKV
jgi:hypothetical protein